MTQQVKYLYVVVFLGIISCFTGILWAFEGGNTRINYDPNELTWGPVYRGLAMSIYPGLAQYTLGDNIEVKVFLKNLRNEEFSFRYTNYQRIYRIAMFDSEGRPVERTEDLKNSESSEIKPEQSIGRFSLRSIRVPPWTESTQRDAHRVVILNSWFMIDKAGTYTLIVMQPIASNGSTGASWEDGFLISNAIKINIVED